MKCGGGHRLDAKPSAAPTTGAEGSSLESRRKNEAPAFEPGFYFARSRPDRSSFGLPREAP
jgi:hypothetical protein